MERASQQIGIRKCYDYNTIISMDGQVVLNSDNSVSVYMLNNVGVLAPVILTKECCEVLGSQYTFDVDSQKCMLADASSCSINDVFKVVLNPKGNDGALFYLDNNETCQLSVDFDYLFKVNCSTLSSMIKTRHVGSFLSETTGPVFSDTVAIQPTSAQVSLLGQIKEQQSLCDSYSYQLTELNNTILSTPYSIECLFQQTPLPGKIATATIEPSFSRTAFGGNSAIAPFSFDLADYATGTFCLTEPDGLNAWATILGPIRYQAFLDGDPNSYSCADVQTIVTQNMDVMLKGGPPLVSTCNVPFGTKTDLIKQQRDLLKKIEICTATLNELNTKYDSLSPVGVETAIGQQSLNCETPIDFFETFSVSMTIDVVTSANTLETVYEQQLFGPIGAGNLYNYLSSAGTNSGFYVCGDPNESEIGFNACTPMLFEFEGSDVDNVTACQTVMSNILDGLYEESGLSDANAFQSSLSISALTSNWLHFNTLITDPDVLSLIENQKIKVSFKINHTCGNFCILVDEISLNKICTEVKNTSLFITQPPGFELERIRDNKKSWLANTTPVNRVFDIKNAVGANPIRQTNYDVNDERLVINTKEIDLDINIAAGIENDVWCYIVDNPCILSSTCTPLEISCPTGYTLINSVTCQKTEYASVISAETIYTAHTYSTGSTYSANGYIGGWFYEDITNRPWPIYSLSGSGIPSAATLVDSASNVVNVTSVQKNLLWGAYESPPGFLNYWWLWRLNTCGIWANVYPNTSPYLEWVGFSVCITIPETKTYVMGMAGDDAIRIGLDGQPLVSLIGSGFQWTAWRLIPITLTAGDHIFTIEGFNGEPFSPAIFGFEIYDAPVTTLTGLTGNTQIDPYILFSTKDLDGTPMNLGENSGFSCPSGYVLNTCDYPYTCVKVTTTAPTVVGDCCDPCTPYSASCGNKSFQDDECFLFQDAEVYEFMDGNYTQFPMLTLNGSNCCGDQIDFNELMTQPLSAVTTIEDFEYFLTSELIDAKNRQTISGYPTLKALYERYLNSTEYCGSKSSAFNYMTMDQFAGLIDSYWVDIVEQVIPATTIWGSVKIYSNTIFDQQKYKYKAYSSLFCGNPYSGKTILSPINGKTGDCQSVEVITTPVNLKISPNVRMKNPVSVCNSICLAQMNMGSEFIGSVSIVGSSSPNCDGGGSINECSMKASFVIVDDMVTVEVVNAAPPLTYSWSNGSTEPSIPLALTYSVTITDANCCETTIGVYE